MTQSRIHKSKNMQTLRLPKGVAFPDHVTHVTITRRGNARIITPVGDTWEDFFASPPIDSDFLKGGKRPSPQVRT
jgi:antitoxin VapB